MQNNMLCKKTVYWDLINSNMNKRDVQTGCTGYVHKAAIRVMRIWISEGTMFDVIFFSSCIYMSYKAAFVSSVYSHYWAQTSNVKVISPAFNL